MSLATIIACLTIVGGLSTAASGVLLLLYVS